MGLHAKLLPTNKEERRWGRAIGDDIKLSCANRFSKAWENGIKFNFRFCMALENGIPCLP